MFDGYFPNRFGPGHSAVIGQHGAIATSQLSQVQIRGVMGVLSGIEGKGNLLDFRLKLGYNIKTNMRF